MNTNKTLPISNRRIRHAKDFAAFHSPTLAWVILAISLAVTAIAWYLSSQYIRERATDRFQFRVNEMVISIEQRMLEYEQVLRGGVGLMEASDDVSRDEWRTYFENARFQEYYPGIQGVGFSRVVDQDEKESFVESIRAEGFPNFNLYPEGERDFYTSIVYLEPFDWRNQRAFGFDMYSEATRRAAMDTAINTGQPTISGVVRLVQETDDDVQRGFLLYLPVFENDQPRQTSEQRNEAVIGFVYAPFRTRDLMMGIRKSNLPDIDFTVYDGTDKDEADLLFDSRQASAAEATSTPDFVMTKTLPLRGRDWTIHFASQPNFISGGESAISLAVAFVGLLVDVLLFLVIGSIGRQQRQAEKIAVRMTNEFEKAQKQFQAVCDTANDPIVLLDQSKHVVYGNPAAMEAFRMSEEQLLGTSIDRLFGNSTSAIDPDSPTSGQDEKQCVREDGSSFPAKISNSYWHDGDQQITAIVIRDVTEQKRADALIQQHITELRRSNRDLDAFAYIASHDLRSPLRNIKHLADWVVEDTGDNLPAESADHLQTLRQCVGRMEQLLDDLLQYSRAGRVHDRLTMVDTNELVTKISGMMSKPASMQIRIEGDLPTFRTLKTPLETCLRNLIGNAIKHHDREDGKVSVSALEKEDEIEFVVADDGPGIDTRFQDKVFEIFRTLAPSDWKNSSGMGLSIIKKTVETYGGRIELQSELGQGTRFILHWPREMVMPLESLAEAVEA
ncbi:CHASE domain-containing protein [Rhodopirellula halodulae]|uniref:CHASE domain-containing protein n=1 Tax=Rhodopirellula halodulae TaxID=2894198 RepID=UPI001E30152F|nr:CHASE domain-containing protein [Rhodopirellula sp. JC737]MCC9656820.1 CHASE domain-containing protein [Rhodopirellula sp. JC737]